LEHILNVADDTLDVVSDKKRGLVSKKLGPFHQVKMSKYLFMQSYETNTLPASFNNMFKHNSDIHPHIQTRQSSNIYTSTPKNNFIANLPNFLIPKLWNKWTSRLHLTKSKCCIKTQI
jgi:hypothetical protein